MVLYQTDRNHFVEHIPYCVLLRLIGQNIMSTYKVYENYLVPLVSDLQRVKEEDDWGKGKCIDAGVVHTDFMVMEKG